MFYSDTNVAVQVLSISSTCTAVKRTNLLFYSLFIHALKSSYSKENSPPLELIRAQEIEVSQGGHSVQDARCRTRGAGRAVQDALSRTAHGAVAPKSGRSNERLERPRLG